MFTYSLDLKNKVTDPNGNEIVDLTSKTFRNNQTINNYSVKKVPSKFTMRPDLVSLVEYGDTDYTEYIMMFNQCGNPFSFDKDDVLMIPSLSDAETIVTAYSNEGTGLTSNDASIQDILVKNYYKHSGRHNNVDMSSYDEFENMNIPSGNVVDASGNVLDQNTQSNNTLPYILGNDEQAFTVKNGRLYMTTNDKTTGINDNNITEKTIDAKIQSILNGVSTDLSDSNCLYNGTNLADFIKALNVAEADNSTNV